MICQILFLRREEHQVSSEILRQHIRWMRKLSWAYIMYHVLRCYLPLGIGSSSNLKSSRQKAAKIQKGFFKYVFVSRNTWILGRLKHIETTLIVLPKTIIEAIKGIMNILSNNNHNQCLYLRFYNYLLSITKT